MGTGRQRLPLTATWLEARETKARMERHRRVVVERADATRATRAVHLPRPLLETTGRFESFQARAADLDVPPEERTAKAPLYARAVLLDELEREIAELETWTDESADSRTADPTPTEALDPSAAETLRARIALRHDHDDLTQGLKLIDRAEWQLARGRDCLAPVKVDFLFDLRGGGRLGELAAHGRLDQAREYFRGARQNLVRAEIIFGGVSGVAFGLDEDPFGPARLWIALFEDWISPGYARTVMDRLKAIVERIHALRAPLRDRLKDTLRAKSV